MSQRNIPTIVHLSNDSLSDQSYVDSPWAPTVEAIRQFVQKQMDQEFVLSADDISEFDRILSDSIQTKAALDEDNTLEDIYELCNIHSDLTEQIFTILSLHLSQRALVNPIKDNNVCKLLYVLAKHESSFASKLPFPQTLHYIEQTVLHSTSKVNIFWALIALEIYVVHSSEKFSKEEAQISDQLKDRLAELSMDGVNWDPYNLESSHEYQSSFIARYFLENILPEIISSDEPQLRAIKLSPDKLSARIDDTHAITPVRSAWNIPTNSDLAYYYEVVILTSGSMQFGWATKETDFGEGLDLGDDHTSVAFNGHYRCLFHRAERYPILTQGDLLSWKAGDVVGCLFVPKSQTFAFYLNGVKLMFEKSQNPISFSKEYSYFACASLSPLQHCFFNFGQIPFRYSPEVLAVSFHEQSLGNLEKYQLLETGFAAIWYWFKAQPVCGHVDCWFGGPEHQDLENKFSMFFQEWETIFSDKKNREHLGLGFRTLFQKSSDWLHFSEFLITKLGTEVLVNGDDKSIKSLMCDIKWFICPTEEPNLPTVSKLLELFNPYFQLSTLPLEQQKAENPFQFLLVRNTCLVLSVIVEFKDIDWETVTLVLLEAKHFLKQILASSNESWTLFANECMTVIDNC